MRNKFLTIGSIFLAIIAVIACEEENDYLFGAKGPMIEFTTTDNSDLIYSSASASDDIDLKCNAKWKTKSLSEWIVCDDEGEYNGKVKFQLEENTGDYRMGQIVAYNTIGKTLYDTLTIVQECSEEYKPTDKVIEIASEALSEDLNGNLFSEIDFTVNSTTPWKVYTKEDNDWCTVLTKKGVDKAAKGSFIVATNSLLAKREAYVYIQSLVYPTLKDSILVKQGPRDRIVKVLTPRSKTILLDEAENHFSFSVQADGEWEVENLPNWITLEQTKYEGNASVFLTASITAERRTARIKIKSLIEDDKVDYLEIEQKIIPDGRLKDSLALIAIYNATNGDKWKYNWKFELPLSDSNWPGVFFDEVDGELRVIDLSLLNFNLEGNLPSEIGWLSEIIKIKVQDNKLSGPLTSAIGRLKKLTHVYISRNNFSGEFPDWSGAVSLQRIDMDFNRFEGEFPVCFSLLDHLKEIHMKYNKFDINSCVPKRFGGWRLGIYLNPQREVVGDKSTDYDLHECTE